MATLIVVIALINGVDRYIGERVATLGTNVFQVTRFPLITNAQQLVQATRHNKNCHLGKTTNFFAII